MTSTNDDDDVPSFSMMPSVPAQIVISFLLIPSSILSFIGSGLILHHVRNDKKRKTSPYRRILLGLSFCDIISTVGWLLQPFLMPSNVESPWVWAIGNEATCAFLGTLSQFGVSAHWYSGALSFYFLYTVRFGMRESVFEKRYERVMHGFILSWNLLTAICGAIFGIYGTFQVGLGCWVANSTPLLTAELIAYIYGGIPTMLVLISILVNNIILYCHVRKTIIQGQRRAMEAESKLLSKFGEERTNSFRDLSSALENDESRPKKRRRSSVLRSSDKQWKRVREVGTQSFLYVGAYLLSFGWTIAKQMLDGRDFEKTPNSEKVFLPLLILQSFFLPLQGCFNAIIFFRPKYLQARSRYPNETRRWCIKRGIFGDKIKPEAMHNKTSIKPTTSTVVRINYAGELISSTASDDSHHTVSREMMSTTITGTTSSHFQHSRLSSTMPSVPESPSTRSSVGSDFSPQGRPIMSPKPARDLPSPPLEGLEEAEENNMSEDLFR